MEEENIPIHLIIRYLSNEADTQEQFELFTWVERCPKNRNIFDEWVKHWNTPSSKREFKYDLIEGLKNLNQRIDTLDLQQPERTFAFSWPKVAAAVLILLTGLSLYFAYDFQSSVDKINYVERFNPPGEKVTITLADGSVVKLNSNTTLRYPEAFTGNNREVYLRGEAFFEIKKDSLHPFVVHTGDLTTRVLGTSFNINAKEDHISVSVATGVVSVSQGDLSAVLHPSDRVDYSRTDKILSRSIADLDRDLAWKENALVFDDTPLQEACQKLAEWYGVRVVFNNSTINQCLITGKFVKLPVEKVLHAISFSTGISYSIHNGTVTLSGNGCERQEF